MLDKENQSVKGVSNSTINQARGDIYNIHKGLSVKEVLDIINSVVADKIAIYQKEADQTVQKRLTEFENGLVEKLQEKKILSLDKFNQPAIQMASRKAALGYIQSGDDEAKDNLLDLLLERIIVEEKTTKQHLIDEAISILPSLSAPCLNLLTFLAFVRFTKHGKVEDFEKWIQGIEPVLSIFPTVNKLDIDFLIQANCAYSTSGFVPSDTFIDIQLKKYDLLFRHRPSKEFIERLWNKYHVMEMAHDAEKCQSDAAVLKMMTLMSLADISSTYNKMLITNFAKLQELLLNVGDFDLAQDLQTYYDQSTPYTKEEVEQYFIAKNPLWEEAFKILKREDIATLQLKPVGKYLACRQMSKLFGYEIPIELFYGEEC